jgi:hypothetical protein
MSLGQLRDSSVAVDVGTEVNQLGEVQFNADIR